jgi:murein DD-endopeptidase MepM/ murein hydrolase activator NlpD
MSIYRDFLYQEAPRRGIDPAIAERVANAEGGLAEPARRGTFPTGSSWWAFQLHYGGKGYEHLGTTAGMGNEFTRVTGWQPGDPKAWRDAMRWALDHVKWSGWGAWYGAAHVGISRWQGIDRTFHWEVTPEHEWDYKKGGAPVADPQYCFPVQGYPKGKIPLHWETSPNAADLFAKRGTPVRAMVNGTVDTAAWDDTGGWYVYMVGDSDTKSLHYYMAHLAEKPLVNAGQRVKAGQTIGKVGDTGNAKGTGPHLHIGIGTSIKSGTGAEGGAGVPWPGNNCNKYLQRILDTLGSGAVDPGAPAEPEPPSGPTVAELQGIIREYEKQVAALRHQLEEMHTPLYHIRDVLTTKQRELADELETIAEGAVGPKA